ncbi:TRAP transporter small permease [Rhodobacteraceae bacterium]|nr:TRAP transporter small permease [Paracoccaceae bacterium]
MLGSWLEKTTNAAATGAMWVSSALLVYMVVHINLEIILRVFFDTSTFSMDEFVGYAVGSMTFLALAHTFQQRKHVRVTVLQGYATGRFAIAVELICIALTFGITLFLARYIWRTLARDFSRGTVSPTLTETPIWLIDAAIFLGLSLFLIQLLATALTTLRDGVQQADVVEH